ncbi:MAG: ABC transporter ATP-binding protein, partial [Oscillospiraceae bacterium]|nr:ABC transporter ATP-binding protein [Oscillospiraceae bacterium]
MIKRLAKCVREYKLYAILAPLSIVLEVVMEVLIPKLMARLIDSGIEVGDMAYIWKMGGLLVLAALVSMFFGAFAAWTSSRASAGFAKNIRHDLFYKVQTFSFSSIDKFSPASIVTRLTTDVTRVQMAFMMLLRMAMRAPFMLVFALIMSFSINVKLSLIFLISVPILAFGMSYISLTTHPIFRKVFETYDKLNLIVQENLRGIRVVKSFVREDHEIKKFENVSGEIYSGFTRAQRRMATMSPLMQFSMYLTTLLLSWFGAKLIVTSGGTEMTTGNLTSIISYAGQILSSLMMVSMFLVQMIMSRASAQRIVEVLDEESEIASPESDAQEVRDGSIRFENVDFSYGKNGDNLVLKKINLDIASGQTIGILGGTGSAKSSLVQLIPRLYDVTDGSVKVGGVDVRDYDLNTLRSSVAMVLQKNELFSGTIRDNIRWGNMDATDE